MGLFSKIKSGLLGKKYGPSAEDKESYQMMKSVRDQSLKAQSEGLSRLRGYATQGSDFVTGQAAREEKQARGNFEDQIRQIRERIAQRGLGRSSLGIQAETSAGNSLRDRISAIRASIPERVQAEKERRQLLILGQGASAGRSAATAASALAPMMQSGRAGGMLAPLMTIGGGVLGGIAGGPAGAQAGAQMGGALGSSIQGSAEMREQVR